MASATVSNPAPAGSAAQSKVVYRVKRGDTLVFHRARVPDERRLAEEVEQPADELASRWAAAHDSDHRGRHRNALINSLRVVRNVRFVLIFKTRKARVNNTPGFFFERQSRNRHQALFPGSHGFARWRRQRDDS